MKVHVQCCQKCFLHKNYNHEQYDFHSVFAKIADSLQRKNSIQVFKNDKEFLISKHLSKVSKSKKIYMGNTFDKNGDDSNSRGRPRIQSFQIYFKDLTVYSRLNCRQFPNVAYICNVINVLQKIQEHFYLKSILLKLGFENVHQYIQYRLPNKVKENKTIHYKQIYQVLTQIDFIQVFQNNKQNRNSQLDPIIISKRKKKKHSQIFENNINKYQQFVQPIEELQDQYSKVVTPTQLSQQLKILQKSQKDKLLTKKSRSISKRKLSEDNMSNKAQIIKNSYSSKRSSQNRDKATAPKYVNFAKRIRCKKFSTRYSNLNQRTDIINNLVSREYNKIKQSKYQYLSKEMDIQIQYQNSTNQFQLQALTDSEDDQNSNEIGRIFNNYKHKLSNFAGEHISSVSQPNLTQNDQRANQSQSTSKPSFNNSIGFSNMTISQFQRKNLNDIRPSILGGISQMKGSNWAIEVSSAKQKNQTSFSQIKDREVSKDISCMSIQIRTQAQLKKEKQTKEKNQIIAKQQLSFENQGQNLQIKEAQKLKECNLFQLKQNNNNGPVQIQNKNNTSFDQKQIQRIKQQSQDNFVNSYKTQKQKQQITIQLAETNGLKPYNQDQVIKQNIDKGLLIQQKTSALPTQIAICLNWISNNYSQLLIQKLTNAIELQISIFNLLSNKLQTAKLDQNEVIFIKNNKGKTILGQFLINLIQKILFELYDVNMLKIQHIHIHTVQKILKTLFMYPTISISTKQAKKCQKMIKSIFQQQKLQNNAFQKQAKQISKHTCKIIGISQQGEIQCFSKIQIDQNDFSKSILQSEQGKCLIFNYKSFCKKFQQMVLWFFNPSYFLEIQSIQFQQAYKHQTQQKLVWISDFQIKPASLLGNSHLFMCFSSSLKNEQYTTVKIWKQTNIHNSIDSQQKSKLKDLKVQQRQNSQLRIDQKVKKGELIGQIKKKGDFFFQLNLDAGNYFCQVQKQTQFKNQRLSLLTYCDSTVKIGNSHFGVKNEIYEQVLQD